MEESPTDLRTILPNYCPYIIVESSCTSEEKFSCILRVKIGNEEEFLKWLRTFEFLSNTNWNIRRSKSPSNKFLFSRDYICHHSSFHKKEKQDENSLGCKNKECGAKLTVRIKCNTRHVRYNDKYVKEGYMAIININFVHSHIVNNAESWHWLRRAPEVKDIFLEYFNKGLSPSAARKFHEDNKILSEAPHAIANSRENPPKDWVYRLHNKWLLENSGNIKGESFLSFSHAPELSLDHKKKLLCVVTDKSYNCPDTLLTSRMDSSNKTSNFSSDNSLDNEMIPINEEQKPLLFTTETSLPQNAETEKLLNSFSSEFERIKSMLEKNASDASLMNVSERYLKQLKKLQTPAQLHSFFSDSIFSHRTTFGRRIRVQSRSLSRRKNASVGSLHARVGRPRLAVRKLLKPTHSL